MQKAMIVTSIKGLEDLNNKLAEGWYVVNGFSMPSSISSSGSYSSNRVIDPTCLVIIETRDQDLITAEVE
jgi:uncharacterized protein YfaP (DUF2135 family)